MTVSDRHFGIWGPSRRCITVRLTVRSENRKKAIKLTSKWKFLLISSHFLLLHVCYLQKQTIGVIMKGTRRVCLTRIWTLISTFHSKKALDGGFTVIAVNGSLDRSLDRLDGQHRHFWDPFILTFWRYGLSTVPYLRCKITMTVSLHRPDYHYKCASL